MRLASADMQKLSSYKILAVTVSMSYLFLTFVSWRTDSIPCK